MTLQTALTIAAVVGPLIGVWVGHRLASAAQRQAEVRAERRLAYLKWLRFIDGLAAGAINSITTMTADEHLRSLWTRIEEITTEVDLLASDPVVTKWEALRKKLTTDEINKRYDSLVAKNVRVDVALRKAYRDGLSAERSQLIEAMKRDLGIDAGLLLPRRLRIDRFRPKPKNRTVESQDH